MFTWLRTLGKLLPGNIILADCGFIIQETIETVLTALWGSSYPSSKIQVNKTIRSCNYSRVDEALSQLQRVPFCHFIQVLILGCIFMFASIWTCCRSKPLLVRIVDGKDVDGYDILDIFQFGSCNTPSSLLKRNPRICLFLSISTTLRKLF